MAQVSGHLKMYLTLVVSIIGVNAGDCEADLTYLAQCYQQIGPGCTSSELAKAQSVFDLFVRQSNTLDITKAAKVKGLAYIVQFQ